MMNNLNTTKNKNSTVKVVTFYKILAIEELELIKGLIMKLLKSLNILGTVILAPEGINSTVAGFAEDIDNFFLFIQKDNKLQEIFKDIDFKISYSNYIPFSKTKVKIKSQTITSRYGNIENIASIQDRGHHIDANKWDEIIAEKNTLLIDTRNYYESVIGKFNGAITPKVNNFTEFFKWLDEEIVNKMPNKENKIAIFCTGGIRCEKVGAFLAKKGCTNVYQLDGGIIKYLEQRMNDKSYQNSWEGDLFIFDDRIALDNGLKSIYNN